MMNKALDNTLLRFPNDVENLEHQFEVYEALYTWCRLELAKGEEQSIVYTRQPG